jgi:L-ascorbate metabolism protein UlaG (beta-lactamase superfamily)
VLDAAGSKMAPQAKGEVMPNDDHVYLKPNVQVEPLIDHWYAWPHLIPPATAARNITERHLKIMDSYINTPQIHATAAKNPKMLGGPFIDLGGKKVEEVRGLRDSIKRDRTDLIELSAAIASLDKLLRENAKGFTLQSLYASVPDALQGYVELVYDLNNQPSFRLIEPLLYKSKYYNLLQQTFMLSTITHDDRPFILSTPRFASADSFHLKCPFSDETVDYLFWLKTNSRPWSQVKERLNPAPSEEALVRSLFTSDAPQPYTPYSGSGVRWRYFGHACILIETQGVSMLFDPVLSYTYESNISRYTYNDLPDHIDYVLITHNHQDHVLFETLLQIRHRVKNIIVPRNGGGHLQDPALKLILENCGFRNVLEVSELEEIRDGNVCITGLPFLGEHADLDITSKMAWSVRVGPIAMLFAADSCNIEPKLYEHIHKEIGDVDVLFLGMECDGAPLTWLYGPLLTQYIERAMDESRRLAGSNYAQGKSIVDIFNCREVYVYAMGQEPWLNYIMSVKYTEQSRPIIESNRLLEACREKGLTAERLFGEKEILIDSSQALESALPGVCCR